MKAIGRVDSRTSDVVAEFSRLIHQQQLQYSMLP